MAFAPNNAVAVLLLLALVAVASAVVPSFTANPTSVVVNDHQAVSFSVTVAGTAPLTIQWQENNGKDTLWADISGATTSTLDISSSLVSRLSNQGWRYRAVATNLEGQAISTDASVTINIPPEIVAQNTTVTGSNNGFVSLFSLATGTPSPSVQWQVSTDRGVTYSPIAGANAPIYTFRVTNANNGNFYRAVYSNPAGTDTSDDILLIVPLYTAASVFVHPLSQTIVLGTDVTFSVDFSGGELPTVQWQIFTTLANRWLDIQGATAASYTRVAVSDADRNARFRAVVTNRLGVSISNEALLTIPLLTPPAIIVQPSFAARTTWGTLVTLRTRASGSPVPTARWERTLSMSPVFFPIGTDGSTQPDLSFIAQPNDTLSSFRVVYTNSQGSVTSTVYLLTLLVPSAPLFDVQPVPLTVQENEFARFTVVVSGSPLPNLQWQVSTDLGFTYTNITNQYSDSLIVQATNAVNHKLFYRVLANNTQGFAFSNPAYLTVVRPDAPLIRRHPASQEVPVGQPVVFDVEASALPPPTYQWESSQDGVNFAPLAGATFVSLRFPAVAATQQNTYYRVRVTNSAGAATSNPALLTVFSLNAPVVTVQPKSKNIPINTAVSLFSTAAGTPAPTVQWFSRASAAEAFAPIAGATATTYHFAATEFRQYRAVFSNANGSANSTIATVNVYGRLYRVTRSSSSSAASSIGLHAAVAAAVVALLALLSL